MKIKHNEATRNRPKGDRIINAPLVIADLQEYIDQLREEKTWKKNDRNGITLFKSQELAVVLVGLHAGAEINENRVDGFIMIQAIEGHLRMLLPDRQLEIRQNQMIILHPRVRHSILALEDSIVLISNSIDEKNWQAESA